MRTRERWSSNRRGCPVPTRVMRVRTLPTVLPHAQKRVRGYLLFDNCTLMPCDNTRSARAALACRRAIGRGVTEARLVRDQAAEVRLLPSGRSGTQAHADERPVEAREAAGSTPASSASWTWCRGNMPDFQSGVVGSIPTVRTGTAM